jgi:hypothetical protein
MAGCRMSTDLEVLPEHEHDFDDCKCFGQSSYCLTCGRTEYELELIDALAEMAWRISGLEK